MGDEPDEEQRKAFDTGPGIRYHVYGVHEYPRRYCDGVRPELYGRRLSAVRMVCEGYENEKRGKKHIGSGALRRTVRG